MAPGRGWPAADTGEDGDAVRVGAVVSHGPLAYRMGQAEWPSGGIAFGPRAHAPMG